jgi:GNAT superfamily N-acetyltransferase
VVDVVIRSARPGEIAGLGAVERDGDRRFAGYDGVPPGLDDAMAPARLERARDDGRLWVAVKGGGGGGAGTASDEGGIIGFAVAETVDGHAHLAQLSVRLASQNRGVGRRLVEAVGVWARDQGLGTVTLCTFADVDWNRPLYEHLGFVVLPEGRWTPGVRALFESDGRLGLDLGRRVVMELTVPAR